MLHSGSWQAPLGWMLYGLGGKATSSVVFLIGPLMLTNTARLADEEAQAAAGTLDLPDLLPTSVPSIAISVALLVQCVAAPMIALMADRYGLRRILMALHIFLGLCCNVALGLTSEHTPVAVRAALLAGLYYAMALAWMFQNSLLPSVASSAQRPSISLASAGLSNIGAGLFLLLQFRLLSGSESDRSSTPSDRALDKITLIAAAIWFMTAVPSIALLATLKAEPLAPDPPSELEQSDGTAKLPSPTEKIAADAMRGAAAAEMVGEMPRVRVGIGGILASVRRLRRHRQATRFVLAQSLYLTAATADGSNGAVFAQEVVGLPVSRIVRLAIFGAVAGAVGSAVTAALARAVGARPTLCGLMSVPPLLLLYTSLVLDSEEELLYIGMLRALVAGGVGFHGLNRGVFSQMVPSGHEAEFFGAYERGQGSTPSPTPLSNSYPPWRMKTQGLCIRLPSSQFVAIKATSWAGPLTCALINEMTGSLRLAILAPISFYLPSLLVMAIVDFGTGRAEASLRSPRPSHPRHQPHPPHAFAPRSDTHTSHELRATPTHEPSRPPTCALDGAKPLPRQGVSPYQLPPDSVSGAARASDHLLSSAVGGSTGHHLMSYGT